MRAKRDRKPCPVCSTPVENLASRFCSQTCHQTNRYNDWVALWLQDPAAVMSSNSIGNVSRHIRRWLRERRGNACELCGWAEINPTTGTIPVEVDHIDGNNEHNTPENLRLLCPNCHSLTPTYRALNKGNGREWRRTNTAPFV